VRNQLQHHRLAIGTHSDPFKDAPEEERDSPMNDAVKPKVEVKHSPVDWNGFQQQEKNES